MPGLTAQPERRDGLQSSSADDETRVNPGAVAFDAGTASPTIAKVSIRTVPLGISEAREMIAAINRLSSQIQDVHQQSLARDNQLKHDMDQMKRDGWSVPVGPFQSSPLPDHVAPGQPKDLGIERQQDDPPHSSKTLVDVVNAKLEGLLNVNDTIPTHKAKKQHDNECDYNDGKVKNERYKVCAALTAMRNVEGSQNVSHKQGCRPDCPMPSVEDPGLKFVKANSSWQPLAIRRLPPLPAAELSVIPGKTTMKTFSWGFLQEFYGGKQWSPSFYYVPPSHGKVLLPSRSWYGIDAKYEPYMPHSPGAHGAKLTAFFNPDSPEDVHGDENGNSLHNVPLFISASNWATDLPEKQYVYFGMYSQLRFSDKLDYERMVESVPHEVKMYWAEQLSSPARPEWVTDQLKKHFFPKPEYQGHLPGPDVDSCVVRSDFAEYRRELQEWESDASMVAGSLSKEEILQAFEQEDANEPRGLRLWWEYLQCIGWDSGFYHMLLKAQGRYCKSVHL